MPSAMRKLTARPWSASTRCARCETSLSSYATPDSRSTQSMISRKPSVSKTELTSCSTQAVRSSPFPVSTFGVGSSTSLLPGCRSYAMKTRL